MTDGFPDRLTQLRARWQGDPSSRVFLQLAEEYRHLGRVQDALAVLEAGLKEHPGYLSALVAKGRCLLELGNADQARGMLERVVQQDATHMVANKLLVRTYLETGDPERARQRLELYSLLNDSDPEIEELRRRVAAMSRPPRAPDGPRSDESSERSRMDPTETPEAEVFDLGPAAPVRSAADPRELEEDVFGLGELPELPDSLPAAAAQPAVPQPAAPSRPAAPSQPAAPSWPPTAPPSPSATAEPVAAVRSLVQYGEGNGAEPFPDPAPEESLRLYLASLQEEGIFLFEAAAETATPETAAETPAAAVGPGPAAALAPAAVVPAPEAPVPATVTLGELYLRQGHQEEAERIFRLVLDREPDNAAAHAALSQLGHLAAVAEQAEVAERVKLAEVVAHAEHAEAAEHGEPAERLDVPHADRQRLDAGQLLAGLDAAQASPSVRKAYLLRSYLTRLRQARRSHVP